MLHRHGVRARRHPQGVARGEGPARAPQGGGRGGPDRRCVRAAHERGVIHSDDIKPQNVLVTISGDLKVTDFSIARAASAATISVTNAVFGTAGYLSPEQAPGEPVSPRGDLYSRRDPLRDPHRRAAFPGRQPPGSLHEARQRTAAPAQKTEPRHPRGDKRPRRKATRQRPREPPRERLRTPGGPRPRAGRPPPSPAVAEPPPKTEPEPHSQTLPEPLPATAPVAIPAVLGTVLLGLSQERAGDPSLPRVEDAARGPVDPPSGSDGSGDSVPAALPPDDQNPAQDQYAADD
jgi:serine/threonine protein kinase